MLFDKIPDADTRKMVVDSGQAALKALLLINGGATISFLTFIGTAIEQKLVTFGTSLLLVSALQCYIAGVVFTAAAYGFIYLTNVFSAYSRTKIANVLAGLTIVFGLGALVSFCVGSVQAIDGFGEAGKAYHVIPH